MCIKGGLAHHYVPCFFHLQSFEWDVEVPESVETPCQRPAGPDQKTQGNYHTPQTLITALYLSLKGFSVTVCLFVFSLKHPTRLCLPKLWWSQVRHLSEFSTSFQTGKMNKSDRRVPFSPLFHIYFTVTCWNFSVNREPARPWQGSGLCEEAGSGPGWWWANQRSVRNLGQPRVLLQASWSLCGECWVPLR